MVTFARSGVTVTVPCATLSGSWASAPSGSTALLAVHLSSVDQSCPTLRAIDPHLDWLEAASGFRTAGSGLTLLDADGRATVALERAPGTPARPAVGTGRAEEGAVPGLPAGVEPATRDDLVGRWTFLGAASGPDGAGGPTRPAKGPDGVAAVGRAPVQPFVELRADGSWTGSDGCNEQSGHWSAGGAGRLVAVSQPTVPLVRCDGPDVGHALTRAARAGIDEDRLVLVDAAGRGTATLVRG